MQSRDNPHKRGAREKAVPGLSATVTTASVGFLVAALVLFGGLLLILYTQSHEGVIAGNQRYIAQDAARSVSGFIQDKVDLLNSLLRMDNPLEHNGDRRRQFLEGVLGLQPPFRTLVLFDADNRVAGRVSRLSDQAAAHFLERLTEHPVLDKTREGAYTSTVSIDPVTSEPLVVLAVPIFDIFRDYRGYIACDLNLKFMWELVESLDRRVNGNVYVVDRNGILIASSDTARVLKGENVNHLRTVANFIESKPECPNLCRYRGINGGNVIGIVSALGTPDWAVVVEVTHEYAYQMVYRTALLSGIVFIVIAVLAAVTGTLIARRIAAPIVHLTQTAGLIASGAHDIKADVGGPREVASLASAFNSMTSQLLQSQARLERQLDETNRAQEALRENEERLRGIIDSANEIIYTLSPDGLITFVSPAWTRFLGHAIDEVNGTRFADFVHPEDVSACQAFLGDVLATGAPRQGVTYRVRHKDGTWRWHTSTGAAVADADGRSWYFVGVAQDITWRMKAEEEKTKLEQQLFQAQKMESIGRLAGGVAHDFNNMLNVILGYSEIIKLESATDEPLMNKIGEIERAAAHARDITRQLLAFSRKQIISPVSIDINERIAANRRTLARLIGEDIDFRFLPGPGLWKVKLDPAQLDQIVYNLAINARDAMPDGGKLTIETSNATIDDTYCEDHLDFTPGRYVLLAVSDNGIGMDRETLSHLFEPFFTTKEVGKGTGLGLATVYGIVRQNGGFINAYSEPGQGTSFRIYFSRDEEPEARGEGNEAAGMRGAGGGTILMVEDDEMVRRAITMQLDKLGYDVLAVRTPAEALSVCENREREVKLLLTDVVMPGMNGVELKQRIVAIRPGMKVLFMSGYTANSIVQHGVLDPDVHFIQKPFGIFDLEKKVREAIAD